MNKKFFFVFVGIYLFFASIVHAQNTADSANFLTVSDIHFNPFNACDSQATSCEVVDKLRAAPASQWKIILTQYDKAAPVYKKDSGFLLFESALQALKKEAKVNDARFVLALGDFLAHDFKLTYQHYTGDPSADGIQAFVDKTMAFIMSELRNTFPATEVYAVVGNNDTYGEHYESDPAFYKNMTPIWSQLINDKNSKMEMEQVFHQQGYYALTPVNQKNIRLIVLNTTLFSPLAEGTDAEAEQELKWFHKELSELTRNHQKALIAMHIPVGVDVYKTVKTEKTVPFWKSQYANRFLADVQEYAFDISAILPGHLHQDWFQVMSFAYPKIIPVSATPAISPQTGNNPGFKIYRYHTGGLWLEDAKTFFYSLDETKQWNLEYQFNEIYQPSCQQCQMVDGMSLIRETGALADAFKKYYAVSQNAQPITTKNKWLPYYWCAIFNVMPEGYSGCAKLPNN